MISFVLLGLISFASALNINPTVAAPNDLQFISLNQTRNGHDALCLDGSLAGFYIAPGSRTQFLIYFQGGGWCYSLADCAYRANTTIGSSRHWPSAVGGPGLLSPSALVNPGFHAFTRVYVPYCDGCSFTGERAAAVQGVWFRGKTILKRVLEELVASFALDKAAEVLVSGCSAGGLSAILHVDRVAEYATGAKRVAAVPDSGFFLNASNANGDFVYGEQMSAAYTLHNASAGTNQACVRAWNNASCVMAPYVLPFVKSPVFLLNSFYDSWQMGNVVGVSAQSFQKCADHGPSQCNATELAIANQFRTQLVQEVKQGSKIYDGYALESCWTHCQMWSDYMWGSYQINGKLVRDVVQKWFSQVQHPKPSVNWRNIDCVISKVGQQTCNPTCPSGHVSNDLSFQVANVANPNPFLE